MASSDEQLLMGEQPSRDQVRKAVADSRARDPQGGRVMKVLYLDDTGESVGEWASKQLPEDPFVGVDDRVGLREPPYSLEQLVFLAESHPVHSSALEQKAADVCGEGWDWVAEDEDVADEAEKDVLAEWFDSLADDDSDMEECINAMWLDKETVGWGLAEFARDPKGQLRKIYHVPGHTVRAHKDGFRLCQIRDQRKVWFRRWGATDIKGQRVNVDEKTGRVSTDEPKNPANDMLVIKGSSRRSSWYGIPGYVSAIGWITLAIASRDDNILFFHNRREPRWAIVLSGLSDNDDLEDMVRRAFTVDLKSPYRNILIPLTGTAKIDFQKMSDTAKDGSFEKLSERADRAVTVAHRLPAGRIANAEVGPLGGNNVFAENRIYKDAVVDPGQRTLAKRINRVIEIEYEIATGRKPTWQFKLNDLDVTNEEDDLNIVVSAFKSDLITLREARQKMGRGPLMKPIENDPETGRPPINTEGDVVGEEEESPYNDMLYTELPGVGKGGGGNGGQAPAGSEEDEESEEGLTPALQRRAFATALERTVRDLVRNGQEIEDRLQALTDEYGERDDDS